jgi:hypothetical protein
MPTATHETAGSAAHTDGPRVVVDVKVTIKAVAFEEADGGYSVVVPELPGCMTVGGVSRCRNIPITHRERRSPNACFR